MSMKSKIVVAFGLNNGFFIEYDGERKYHDLHEKLQNILEAGFMEKVVSIAMNEEEWIVVYEDNEGGFTYGTAVSRALFFIYSGYAPKFADYQKIPTALEDWFQTRNHVHGQIDLSTVEITLRNQNAFFATAINTYGEREYRWCDIPSKIEFFLQGTIAKGGQNPSNNWHLCFGAGGKYVIYQKETSGNNRLWYNVQPESEIATLIDDSKMDIRGTRSTFFVPDEYFALRRDGSARWLLNEYFSDDVKGIAAKILAGRPMSGSTSPGKRAPSLDSGATLAAIDLNAFNEQPVDNSHAEPPVLTLAAPVAVAPKQNYEGPRYDTNSIEKLSALDLTKVGSKRNCKRPRYETCSSDEELSELAKVAPKRSFKQPRYETNSSDEELPALPSRVATRFRSKRS